MSVVVVGGQARNVGKTSVVAELIAALPEKHWTGIKITQCGHSSTTGEVCDCELAGRAMAFREEFERSNGTDSSRYLAAGAASSFWLRTRRGHLSEAMPQVQRWIAAAENTVIESNSVLEFLRPDVALSVLDPSVADFKSSAARLFERADAVILPEGAELEDAWSGAAPASDARRLLAGKPRFFSRSPVYASTELVEFVARRLAASPHGN